MTAFGRLAAAISVVRTALEHHQTRLPQAIATLDETISVLQAVRKIGDETGCWEISEGDRPVVLSGIEMAEESIGTLDVALLAETAAELLRRASNEQ